MSRPPVVIPAAGLGSRLGDLTRDCPKELLPLAGRPVLHGAVLELEAAGVTDAVVVTSPSKPGIAAWVAEHAPWIAVVQQPEPLGVFDAVERARAVLGVERLVVLFPDYVALPDQRGLAALLDGVAGLPAEASAYGLHRRRSNSCLGPSASVGTEPAGDCLRIASVEGAKPDGLHTALAELRGTEHTRRIAGGDGGIMELLSGLARERLLFGVELPGDLIDIGTLPGHADAVRRFEDGRAAWRE